MSQPVALSWNRIQTTLEQESKIDTEVFKKMRGLVLEVIGSEETGAAVDDACVHFLQLFIEQKSLTMELFRSLKLKYGSISQGAAQKIFATVKEMTRGIQKEVLNHLLCVEEELDDGEEGDYFGKNIPFNRDTGDFWTRVDLSYLTDIAPPTFSLDSQLTFDINQQTERHNNIASAEFSSNIDAGWLENILLNFYADEKPLGMSIPEFAIMLLEKLGSDKSGEELQ